MKVPVFSFRNKNTANMSGLWFIFVITKRKKSRSLVNSVPFHRENNSVGIT